MRIKSYWTPLLVATSVLTADWIQHEHTPSRVRWEYKVIYFNSARPETVEDLNRLGAEGWELVFFSRSRLDEYGSPTQGYCFLKRPR
ncbi:hypothetical protein HRbin10_00355 [bacterium HR10]|nr:hypothetical protein HRbin10_00355 [bacterium HR10]